MVFLGDGGGVEQALPRPVVGACRVARLLAGGSNWMGGEVAAEPARLNGRPALVIRLDGEIDAVVALRIDDGLVTGLYFVRNPEKLSRVERETTVSR